MRKKPQSKPLLYLDLHSGPLRDLDLPIPVCWKLKSSVWNYVPNQDHGATLALSLRHLRMAFERTKNSRLSSGCRRGSSFNTETLSMGHSHEPSRTFLQQDVTTKTDIFPKSSSTLLLHPHVSLAPTGSAHVCNVCTERVRALLTPHSALYGRLCSLH